MTLDQFWQIIDSTGEGFGANRTAQIRRISAKLKKLDLDELASFNKHLHQELRRAYSFRMMVATFVVFGRVNDDLLLDFRAWAILLGSKAFTEVAKNPDVLAKFLKRSSVDQIRGGKLHHLAQNICASRGADVRKWVKKVGYLDEPIIATPWPKDQHAFKKKYPVLYRAFWDQDRINAHHQSLDRLGTQKKPPRKNVARKPGKISSGEFWKIIDSTASGVGADRQRQVEKIRKALEKYDLEGLASFKRHLNRELLKANTFHFMVAAFLLYGYISDDFFLEFSSWVLLNGRRAFSAAVKNPDTIAKLISRDEVSEFSVAGFPELACSIWLTRSDDDDAFFDKAGHLEDPTIDMPWPESKSEFEERYPVLTNAFWNLDRIKMFHAR